MAATERPGLPSARADSGVDLRELLLIAVIVLAAVFLRLHRIDSVPPGVTHDEADTGYFVAAVSRGEPAQVEAPYGWAYEPFTQYSAAPFMWLFGQTDLALRIHSGFFGILLLAFTYLWVRCAFGVPEAIGSAALVAVSFWTVASSRFALNPAPAPALFTGAAYFMCAGLKGGVRRPWAWAGFTLCLAGSLYVYEVARAASIALVFFLAYLALFARPAFRRSGPWLGGSLVVAGLIAAPHLLDPGAWGRSAAQSGPLRSALVGDFGPLLSNAIGALGTFTYSGDSFVTYNLPGRPIFGPAAGLFFYAGVVLCLLRWRRPAHAFTLLWLVFGVAPSLVVGEWTSTLHSMGSQAPIMALPAIAAGEAGRYIAARCGARWQRAFVALCALGLASIAGITVRDYFGRWANAPGTRAAYFSNLTAISDYLEEGEYSGSVVLSAPFPDLPLDPFITDLRLHRADVMVRWSDVRSAIVFPDDTRSLLIVPPNTPLDPLIQQRLDLELVERVCLRADDIDPYFDVFIWRPGEALHNFLAAGHAVAEVGGREVSLPIVFGGVVELLSFEVHDPTVSPGDTVTVVTVWRVVDPSRFGTIRQEAYGFEAALFVHVLDAEGGIVAQDDRLDAPAWNWRPGDAFVQLHRLQLPPALEPGSYALALGIYTYPGSPRLPVSASAGAGDDHVQLPPVKVRAK